MRRLTEFLMLIFLTLFALKTLGDVYRWTDSEGQVHYSDRKPAHDAEEVSAKVRVQNIDTSQEEQRKLQSIFRAENDADREFHRQQQQRRQPSKELMDYCRKLHAHLRMVSGRIQFVDDDGKEVRFTERERQQHVQEMQQLANERCAHVSQ